MSQKKMETLRFDLEEMSDHEDPVSLSQFIREQLQAIQEVAEFYENQRPVVLDGFRLRNEAKNVYSL